MPTLDPARYRVPERPPSYVPRARRPDLPANATDKAPAEQCANFHAEGVLAEAGGDRLDSGSGATACGAAARGSARRRTAQVPLSCYWNDLGGSCDSRELASAYLVPIARPTSASRASRWL